MNWHLSGQGFLQQTHPQSLLFPTPRRCSSRRFLSLVLCFPLCAPFIPIVSKYQGAVMGKG
ncbi:hypothetical protein BDV33DRAFT_26066 [Aspergillus novoparasiticus]|uniref:Uncharacterized protein n=1 Tax=Aspergillus novoparasiticus TaxID=986946 RepID=A0A5N6EB12_9EURO|nr:hypothetical protein BDV33DRAFT_26066 [Aspergillus novoparasiticus]